MEDFRKVTSAKITNQDLQQVLSRLSELKASEVVPDRLVADAYGMIRSLLEDLPRNPVYKEIRGRIERARVDWIARNIDTADFLEVLESSIEEKLEYDEKISAMKLEERIAETIETIIRQRLGLPREVALNLGNFRQVLREVVSSTRIVSSHAKEIRTALMKDLLKEVKGKVAKIDTKKIWELCEELKDYVVEELKESKRDEKG